MPDIATNGNNDSSKSTETEQWARFLADQQTCSRPNVQEEQRGNPTVERRNSAPKGRKRTKANISFGGDFDWYDRCFSVDLDEPDELSILDLVLFCVHKASGVRLLGLACLANSRISWGWPVTCPPSYICSRSSLS